MVKDLPQGTGVNFRIISFSADAKGILCLCLPNFDFICQ